MRLSLVVFFALASTANAQGIPRFPSPDTLRVPRELVLALIGGYARPDTDAPRLVVGRLPDSFPAEMVPPGAVVLGGMSHAMNREGMNGTRGTAIIVLQQNAMQATADYEAHLQRAGWRRPAGVVEDYGGFVPPPAPRPLFYCKESSMLNGYVVDRPAGGSHLRLDLTSGMEFTPCDPRTRSSRPMRPVALPTLTAPAAAVSTGQAFGGGRDYREASTRLRTTLGSGDIIAHYAAQLEQGGWRSASRTGDRTIAAQTFTRTDDEGKAWFATLTAFAIPDTDFRDVVLRVISTPPAEVPRR